MTSETVGYLAWDPRDNAICQHPNVMLVTLPSGIGCRGCGFFLAVSP